MKTEYERYETRERIWQAIEFLGCVALLGVAGGVLAYEILMALDMTAQIREAMGFGRGY